MQSLDSKISKDFITSLCQEFKKYNRIDPDSYVNYKVKRGLRNADGTGVMAGITMIGNVEGYYVRDGDRVAIPGKLIYRGIDVEDLIDGFTEEDRFGFEEVCYLLLFGALPNAEQLKMFTEILEGCRELPENFTQDMILKAPSPDVMNKLGRSILALYSYDDNPDDLSLENLLRQSIELIARVPTIVAHAYAVKRHVYDKESLFIHPPLEGASTAEDFLHILRPDNKFTLDEARLLDLCMVLHAEHGGGNNSAFACRVLSSSGTDTYAAISGACGSLKGPKHGGANIKVMEMFSHIREGIKDWKDDEEVANYLRRIIRKEVGDLSGLIYGMGHAIYTVSDPRTIVLKKYAHKLAAKNGFSDELNLMESVERLTPSIFKEEKGDNKVMCANVDMYSGLVYQMLGIPQELYTAIFAIARMSGWVAHRIEEVTTGGRIMRPAYKALCEDRPFVKLADR